jgi:hypothetical protein
VLCLHAYTDHGLPCQRGGHDRAMPPWMTARSVIQSASSAGTQSVTRALAGTRAPTTRKSWNPTGYRVRSVLGEPYI